MKIFNRKYGYLFIALLSMVVMAISSCDKDEDDDDFEPQATNYITFAPLLLEVEVEESAPPTSLALKADIKEFPGLEVTNIDLYFIPNSNEYTKRVTESASFTREADGNYFNNKLGINYLGEKQSTDFQMPFDQYEATINVPLNQLPPVIGDYFYAGIELTYSDGSKYRGTTRVDYVEPEE